MNRILAAICMVFSVCVLSVLPACEDPQFSQNFPLLNVSEDAITMPSVGVGSSVSKDLILTNIGDAPLLVDEILFSNGIDTREFKFLMIPGPDRQGPPCADSEACGAGLECINGNCSTNLPLWLDPEEAAVLRLVYSPLDANRDQGTLIIRSTDSNNRERLIPINTSSTALQLVARPDPLELFSQDGSAVEGTVTIANFGASAVAITGLSMSDGSDSELTVLTEVADPIVLRRGEDMLAVMQYVPRDLAADRGTLIIEHSDIDVMSGQMGPTGEIEVLILGSQPSPAITVMPGAIAFGAIELDTDSGQVQLTIGNEGTADLLIDSIGLAVATPPPNNEQFTLHDLPEMAGGPFSLPPGMEHVMAVSYHPVVEGAHSTAIVINSNDPLESVKTVPVSGRVRQPCIQAIPEAVDFGVVALNVESARTPIEIMNCGDLPLLVNEINIDDNGFDWAPVDPMRMLGQPLMPLESMPIEVWYTNQSLVQGQRIEATMTVTNNTPDNSALPVPLIVTGGGAPTCNLLLLPRRVNFGLVARGRSVTRGIDILNRGTGDCQIRSQEIVPLIDIPIPGFNEVRFFITRQAPLGRIAPGSRIPMEITYRPQLFNSDLAKLNVNYFDPHSNMDKVAEADLSGIGGESNIEVIPGRLDFGRVTAGECASREERVTVYNTGLVNLCITGLRLEGPNCDEFLIVDRPIANQDGCILVSRNNPAEVRLVYEPTRLGPSACELIFESDANNAPELRVPLDGEGTRDRRQTDIFEQTSGQTVDVLFVIDNSGSMGEEQDNIRDNFRNFINGAQQFANDYQLGIVTTDMDDESESGRLQGDPRVIGRGAGVENQFDDATRVGTQGSGQEKGLAAAEAALSDPLIFDTGVACNGNADCVEPDRCVGGTCGGYNRGFLRDDAALEVVFVSDEDDDSPGTLNFYVDFLKNIKGFRNEGRFHAHAIVGAENGRASACQSPNGDATRGARYVEVAQRTNGGIFSICDADFGQPLQEIGNQAFGLPVQFFLSRPAIEATIEVQVDGARQNQGWVYDEESNSIIFQDGFVPQPRQTIQVDYEVQCFERRGG